MRYEVIKTAVFTALDFGGSTLRAAKQCAEDMEVPYSSIIEGMRVKALGEYPNK